MVQAGFDEGRFDFGDGVLITPATDEQHFRTLAPRAEPMIFNGDYHSYSLSNRIWHERHIGVVLYFYRGKLSQLHLSRSTGAYDSWDNWSEEAVREDKSEHDRWLRDLTGSEPPYVYDWGDMTSLIDWKGGFSAIFVDFDPNHVRHRERSKAVPWLQRLRSCIASLLRSSQ